MCRRGRRNISSLPSRCGDELKRERYVFLLFAELLFLHCFHGSVLPEAMWGWSPGCSSWMVMVGEKEVSGENWPRWRLGEGDFVSFHKDFMVLQSCNNPLPGFPCTDQEPEEGHPFLLAFGKLSSASPPSSSHFKGTCLLGGEGDFLPVGQTSPIGSPESRWQIATLASLVGKGESFGELCVSYESQG